jgi:2-polyprenyl-3-methyl-5-hydroxy-6-metoxy-1,4-benzoquinol methylase
MELIREQKRDWDELGKMDPLWAVLSDPQRQHGRWDIEEFFDTGERDVAAIFNSAAHLSQPRNHDRALDFGCAVGRLTRALAPRFAECWGVDISEAMVRRAQELNRDISNCNFVVNAEESLGRFQNDYFDFVLSILVLQHLRFQSCCECFVLMGCWCFSCRRSCRCGIDYSPGGERTKSLEV